jgi:hypothetical protein
MSARTHIPEHIQQRVFDRSRRRCALCIHFDNDWSQKNGQIAHLDRNPSNCAEDNLAYLCLSHHDDYDTKRRQTKDLTISEAKTARNRLHAFIENGGDLATAGRHDLVTGNAELAAIRLQLQHEQHFGRRYAIFDAARTFLIKVLQTANVSRQEIYTFIRKTEDTVFILDDDLVTYFEDWKTRAFRLLLISSVMDTPGMAEQRAQLVEEKWQIVNWFEAQLDVLVAKFTPFLRPS